MKRKPKKGIWLEAGTRTAEGVYRLPLRAVKKITCKSKDLCYTLLQVSDDTTKK